MTIRFRCPHCKKPLGVKDHLAGKKAACPACKKGLVIPAAPAAKAAAIPAPTIPEPPPPNVDELAAAAFGDLAETNGKAEAAPATIDFQCEACETPIHAPRSEAGKRMQCPNPECRQLVKVPVPKEKPKDWRDLAKKGPTVAQMTQPDKIDEAAWGTQTDKTRAGSESLKQAGAVVVPPRVRIGVRDWIQRGMVVAAVGVALVVTVVILSRVRTVQQEKDFVRTLLPWVEGKGKADESIANPVVRAEVYRAIGEYKARRGKKNSEVLDALQKALASARQPAKESAVERDLFLGKLALTITELGGTEQEEIAKEKYDWKGKGGTIRKELLSTLEAIQAPEARVMALRALTTRLLELEQAELAVGLASQLSNSEKGRRPPATAQLVTLLLLKDKKVDHLVRVPDLAKELPEPLARSGFAEYHARKGDFVAAKELAIDAKGPAIDQLAACVGVAQVILSQGKNAQPEPAVPFAERALEIASGKTRLPPWLLLQTIRVVARVKGSAAVPPAWLKQLPPDFAARGTLEMLQADLAATATAVPTTSLADLKDASGDSPALDFGWEALARQNARAGRPADIEEEATYPDNHRFFPMVRIGVTLGESDRR